MDINKFKESRERQIHNSLDELFEKANLSEIEKEIYIKYQNYCEYWLLRTKVQLSEPFNSNENNFIKLLAIVLLNLHSNNVSGAKGKLVRKMFSDKTVHKVYETKGGGVRSTKNSSNIENSYFELEILSYFLKYRFKIELPSDKISGKKIPEFVAVKNGIRINVEAKKLDYEKILDNIHGDCFTLGFDKRLSKIDKEKGSLKILDQFKRNYRSAIGKYKETNENEYFIIFIQTHYKLEYLGKNTIDYMNNLRNDWIKDDYNRLIGVVLPDSEKTIFIKNKICDFKAIQEIESTNINDFHNYYPELLTD